jgi:hypothetical protein
VLSSPCSVFSFFYLCGSVFFPLMVWFYQIHGFGSINLKSMQAENLSYVVPPTSRSTNYVVLKFFDFSSDISVR